MGRRKIGRRFQTGHEHDGWEFDMVIKVKFPVTSGETRAVKRDRLIKALRYWARGQMRHWGADWEVYKPLMAEIEARMAGRVPSMLLLEEVKGAILGLVTERSSRLGTSEQPRRVARF